MPQILFLYYLCNDIHKTVNAAVQSVMGISPSVSVFIQHQISQLFPVCRALFIRAKLKNDVQGHCGDHGGQKEKTEPLKRKARDQSEHFCEQSQRKHEIG